MPSPIDRTLILESVLTVWREEGYQGATTRKVAALAGVGEMTLFRRFKDKASLFRAALELEADRFTDAIGCSDGLEADLERVVSAYQALLERSAPIILDFLLEAPRNPELARVGPVPLAAIVHVGSLIMRYQQEGRLRDGPPFEAVLSLLSPIFMSALVRRAQPTLAGRLEGSRHVQRFLDGWSSAPIKP